MGMAQLVLVANPGSASRKYALYDGDVLRASVHFEHDADHVIYTFTTPQQSSSFATELSDLRDASSKVIELLTSKDALHSGENIERIALRIVAPGSYFVQHRFIDGAFLEQLQAALRRAPLHVAAALDELHALREQFPDTPMFGISDSAFHVTKPPEAWLYGIPLDHADHLDIKRYGYHGLSMTSVVDSLKQHSLLTHSTVVAHIGSGVSVTALSGGASVDTTMGYSPLEGVVMASRSGSIDLIAAGVLASELGLDQKNLEHYCNSQGGLLGLGGSNDVRLLLEHEAAGDDRARLALRVYTYQLQKAIGQMSAAAGGIDSLVFTGTIGLRSTQIRERIVNRLGYLGFVIDPAKNQTASNTVVTNIAAPTSKPIYIVATDEQAVMAKLAAETPLEGTAQR